MNFQRQFQIASDVLIKAQESITSRKFVSCEVDEERCEVYLIYDTPHGRKRLIVETFGDEVIRPTNDGLTDEDKRRIMEIYAALCLKYPQLPEYISTVENTKNVIYGLVQQGKTELLLVIVWVSTYVHMRYVSVLLMESIGSFNQFFTRDLIGFNPVDGIQDFPLNVVPVQHIYKDFIKNGKQALRNLPIMVGLANGAQINKMQMILDNVSLKKPFHIVVDEADVAVVKNALPEKDKTVVGKSFQSLKKKAVYQTCITATPFGVWNEEDDNFQTLSHQMPPPPPGYQGVEEFDFSVKISVDDEAKIKKGDYSPVVELVRELCENAHKSGETYAPGLINISPRDKVHMECAKTIAIANLPPNVRGIFILNSKGGRSPIRRVLRNGEIVKTDFKTLPDLYNSFEINSINADPSNPDVFIIIGGHMSGRAVSFRPSKEIGQGSLHWEIYLPAKTSHGALMLQASRLSGVYPEGSTAKMFVTTVETERIMKDELLNYKSFLARLGNNRCDSRKQIEGTRLRDIGKHDRPKVDDTQLDDKATISSHKYDSVDDIKRLLGVGDDKIVMMTCGVTEERTPGFFNTHDPRLQNVQRQNVKKSHNLGNSNLQMGWSKDRSQSLHNPRLRYNGTGQYLSRFTGEQIEGERVRVVEWKPEFCDPELRLHHLREGMVYVYHTTCGKFMFFSHDANHNIKTGFLSHK